MKRVAGFTLIELVVTVFLLGIIAAIAAPSFSNLLANTQIDSNVNTIRSSLIYARSEAVTKSVFVSVCMSSDSQTCVDKDAADWATGWMVWRDIDGDGVLDTDDSILRVFEGLKGTGTTMVETNTNYSLTFNPNGQLEAPAARFEMIMKPENCTDDKVRSIGVELVGRVFTSATGACDA